MDHDNQKFYEWFQTTTTSFESQIGQLESSKSRQKDIDKLRGDIANLSKSLADASDVLPSYDQKSYATTIKGLTEKLDRTADKVAPRSKFQFKARSKAAPATQLATDTRRLDIGQGQDVDRATANTSVSQNAGGSAQKSQKDYNAAIKSSGSPVRKPSFSSAKMVNLQGQRDAHIVLPTSASGATSAGSLQHIDACVVDMSVPAAVTPFAGLALNNIRRSIIVTGNVSGPVHVTGVSESILLIVSRQVRIHECKNVDVYLHCTSHPIIEDCTGMRFAPIPPCYAPPWADSAKNQWDQVDDFKWLKVDHSPNWSTMPDADRKQGDFWVDKVAGKVVDDVASILRIAGIQAV